MEQYYSTRPNPGYQGMEKIIPNRGKRNWRFLKPDIHQPRSFRHDYQVQQRTMFSPKTRWYHPAYERFMPSTSGAYPRDFITSYGFGPRPDHYYPGLTPKDVVLAKTRGRGVVSPAEREAPRILRSHELQSSIETIESITSILYGGMLPTNNNLLYFFNNVVRSIENQKFVSPETHRVLEDLYNLVMDLRDFILQVNNDELVQNLINHSVLSARLAAQQSKFNRMSEEDTQTIRGAGVGLLRMLTSPRFRSIIRDIVNVFHENSEDEGYYIQGGRLEEQGRTYNVYSTVYADGGVSYQVPVQPRTVVVEEAYNNQPLYFAQAETLPEGHRDYANMFLGGDVSIQLVDKIRVLLREIKQNPAVLNALGIISDTILELGEIPGFGQYPDANREAMMYEIKALMERLSGGRSLNNLISIVDEFQMIFREDWYMQKFFTDWGYFLKRCMTDPNYLDGADFSPRSSHLLNQAREIFARQYGKLSNDFLNEALDFYAAVSSSPILQSISDDLMYLYEDLFINPQTGEFTLKKSLLQDLRNVYFPVLMKAIRYIPIPRIEFSDENWDIMIDNVILAAENIIPTLIELKAENQVQVSPRPDLPDAYFLNVITLDVIQIQTDVRNVEFAYTKKTFPKTQDSGLADILIGGNGLSAHIKVAYDPNLWYTTLIPLEIDVKIENMSIKLHDSGNDTLYKIIGPAVVSAIKRKICRNLEEQIFNLIRRADGFLTGTGEKKNMGGISIL